MSDVLEKKQQALEALLHEMERLGEVLREGRFDELDEAARRPEAVIREIETLDLEYGQAGRPQNYTKELVEELKALVARITEINNGLIVTATGQAREVQQELGTLHRRVEATAGYRKQANVKV